MSEIQRLVDGEASPLERALLEAAGAERPADDAARLKTLAALAAASALGAGAATGSLAAKGGMATKLLSVTLTKWVLSAIAIAALCASSIAYLHRAPPAVVEIPAPNVAVVPNHTEAPPVLVATVAITAPLPAPTTVAAPVVLPTTAPRRGDAPAPVSSATVAPRAPGSDDSVVRGGGGGGGGAAASPRETRSPPTAPLAPDALLASEVRLLDEARADLAQRDPHAALSALDNYRRSFPQGTFVPEATVMRIDALLQSGDRPHAEALADAFLRGDPNGPYAKRVRDMIK